MSVGAMRPVGNRNETGVDQSVTETLSLTFTGQLGSEKPYAACIHTTCPGFRRDRHPDGTCGHGSRRHDGSAALQSAGQRTNLDESRRTAQRISCRPDGRSADRIRVACSNCVDRACRRHRVDRNQSDPPLCTGLERFRERRGRPRSGSRSRRPMRCSSGTGAVYGNMIPQLHAWNPSLKVLVYDLGPVHDQGIRRIQHVDGLAPELFRA